MRGLKEYSQQALNELLQSQGSALIEFGTDWCAPCKRLERVLLEMTPDWTELDLGKVNVEDWPECAAEHGVLRNPTLCLFQAGQLTASHQGYLQRSELEDFLRTHLLP